MGALSGLVFLISNVRLVITQPDPPFLATYCGARWVFISAYVTAREKGPSHCLPGTREPSAGAGRVLTQRRRAPGLHTRSPCEERLWSLAEGSPEAWPSLRGDFASPCCAQLRLGLRPLGPVWVPAPVPRSLGPVWVPAPVPRSPRGKQGDSECLLKGPFGGQKRLGHRRSSECHLEP